DFKNTVDLAGGIGAWKKAKLPTRKSPVSKGSSAHTYTQEEFSAHLSSPTPVLLAFQTKWCAPCRKMKPILDQLEDQEREKLKILRIDLDANPSLSEQYKVDSIPAFILIKNNTPLWQDTGSFTLPKFTQILNTHR
ncbi:MAG: thioredoxin family protein, partial [Verrucomicrobiota bacterium]